MPNPEIPFATSLATWLEDIGLLLNAAKTQLLFIKPRGADNTQPEVFCHADKFAVTTSAKYLGPLALEAWSRTQFACKTHLVPQHGPLSAMLWFE